MGAATPLAHHAATRTTRTIVARRRQELRSRERVLGRMHDGRHGAPRIQTACQAKVAHRHLARSSDEHVVRAHVTVDERVDAAAALVHELQGRADGARDVLHLPHGGRVTPALPALHAHGQGADAQLLDDPARAGARCGRAKGAIPRLAL
jgi:hypothetical protein